MAMTAAQKQDAYKFFIVSFGAITGVEYMNQINDAYNAGLTTKEIVNIYSTKPQFEAIYPRFFSNEQFADKLIENVVGASATAAAKAQAKTDVVAALNAGWSKGDVVFQIFTNLSNKAADDADWGKTAAMLNNKVKVAEYYTETLLVNSLDLGALGSPLQSVTDDAASVEAAKGNGSLNNGKTFTLTTGADNFVGTNGNDTFNGLSSSVAGESTINAADKIDGGAGKDTLNIAVTGTATATTNGADIKNIEVVNVRNVGTGTAALDASTVVGLTEAYSDRSTGGLTITNLAAGSTVGLKGNGVANLGTLTATYVNAATAANFTVDGGTSTTAAGAVTINGSAAMTSATITGSNGTNLLTSVAFAGGAAVNALTVDAKSNLTTGNVTGLAANTTITVKGAGAANIGTLLATNVVAVDASANTGGVTTVLNNVTGIKFTGGSGNDVVTTGAVLAGSAAVDAGAGTGDRLVVANSAHVTATVGKFYKGFEQLQVQDGVTVNVAHLADGNTIDTIRINQSGTAATGVTNLSAAQAANVQILAAGGGTSPITIGVKDASAAGQIDTVKAALTTTTAAGAANNLDLTGLTLAGVEKLELTGNGTTAATTGSVTLTTTNATALDSIIIKNAGTNTITIAAGQTGTNLVVDASGSTGNTTIDASAYATTTGAQLLGGSGHDVLLGVTARSDKIVGGAGNDVIAGTAIGGFTAGTATALGTVTGSIAASTAADILTGGEGRDVFAIGQVDAIANISSITDLNLGGNTAATGVDAIYFDLATASTGTAVTVVTLSDAQKATVSGAADLAAAVEAALQIASGVNNAVQFTFGTDTYLAVNGATAGFAVADDALVKITGVVGTLDASDIVII